MSKKWEKKHQITNFKQGELESLNNAWERFKLLKSCPTHELSQVTQMQIFIEGLKPSTWILLDASDGGSTKVKTDQEVQTLIESMAQNEYRYAIV